MKRVAITANGLGFSALEAGSGPLVLLLHGFPETSYSWRHQIPVLAAAGFHVVAPDLRGYGSSDRPGDVAAYDLDELARDVVGWMDALGASKARVVGHDWGGAITWHLGHRFPERLVQLAVLNCPHPGQLLDAWRGAQILRSWYMFFFQLPRIPEALMGRDVRRFVERVFVRAAPPGTFSPEDLGVFAEALSAPGALTAGINYYRANLRAFMCRRRELLALWETPIEVPGMLLWGTGDVALGDGLIPGHGRFFSEEFSVTTVDGAGHWVQQSAPDAVNDALLDYLSSD